MKKFKLIYPISGFRRAGVKDLTDENEDQWRVGHIYEMPDDFYINPDYIRVAEKIKKTGVK